MIIESDGRQRYEIIVDKVIRGCRKLYGSAEENKMKRELHKLKKQRVWYGKTKDAGISMQATPGLCLKKAVEEVFYRPLSCCKFHMQNCKLGLSDCDRFYCFYGLHLRGYSTLSMLFYLV